MSLFDITPRGLFGESVLLTSTTLDAQGLEILDSRGTQEEFP